MKISVVGYGSWATTLVGILAAKKISVNWLVTNPDVRESLVTEDRNCKYVSDMQIDMETVKVFDDINVSMSGCDFVLLACPSAYLDATMKAFKGSLSDKFVLSAIKGIIPVSYNTVLEYVHETYGIPFKQMAVISGPTHAEEVSRSKLSYLTVAGTSDENNEQIAAMFSTDSLIVNTSKDIYGIEYAGVMKNIYAIAAGIAAGLGYGDNFLAVLTASAANEMETFINGSYTFERKISSREYLGDLLVTCGSNFSRNRRLGQLIGKGCSVKSAMNEMTMVAEGYYSAFCIHEVNKKYNIGIPIADMVYKILYEGASPRKAMQGLSKTL